MACGLLLGAAPASAQSPLDVADWTAISANVATGTLGGRVISLSGTHVFAPPVSVLDATWPFFAGPDFAPPLARTDVIQIAGFTGDAYTVQFGAPVTDPLLHVGSLGSRLDFPAGTRIARLSGDAGFTVTGASVIGTVKPSTGPDGINDANGTIRLSGTFTSISFATTPLYNGPEDGILVQVLAPPAGVTAPPPDQTPPPQPTPPAPRVTELRLVAAARAGGPALVSAQVAGAYRRLLWSVRGGASLDLVSGPGQTTLRFRPPPGGATVRLTAVGAGGRSAVTTVRVPGAAFPKGALGRRIAVAVTKHLVLAAGTALAMTGSIGSRACGVAQTRVRAEQGILDMAGGCLTPATSVNDIPRAERGVLSEVARRYRIPLTEDAAQRAVTLSDAYVSRGPVTINGIELKPAPGASVVLFPQAHAIASSDARLRFGPLTLAAPRRFLLDTTPHGGVIPFGSFGVLGGPSVGGFDLGGDVKVDAVRPKGLRGSVTVPGATAVTTLRLPSFLRFGGSDLRTLVTLRGTTDNGVKLDQLHVGPLDVQLGVLAVRRFRLDYTGAHDEWRGTGRACVPSGLCLDMVPPNGSIVIRAGRLSFAGASLRFPSPGVPLFPGLDLQRIGFGIGLDPTRFTGNALVTAARIYDIDGRLVLAFPSAATPYMLNRDEVGSGFPPELYTQRHTQLTVGISADASLRVPALGSVHLAGGYLLYEAPGYVVIGGGVDQSFAGVVSMRGGVAGEFNVANGRFNIIGDVRACLVGVLCRGATGFVSSRGLAACLSVGPLSIGGGVTYSPFSVRIWPLDGCKWSPFKEANVRAAQAGSPAGGLPRDVVVPPGGASRAVSLQGAEGAPRVRVTGPGGQALDSPAASGLATRGSLRIVRQETTRLTVIGLQDPRPGRYRVDALPGSPAVRSVGEATDPPDAKVDARVLGHGSERVLAYRIRRRPAQRVTFMEVNQAGRRTIGTVAGGGTGRLRFTAAPGLATRRIEARFELGGLPAERRIVARFAPPSPSLRRPGGMLVRRRGSFLLVRWSRVPGAAAYEVSVSIRGAGQRRLRVRGHVLTLHEVPRSSSGRVSVRAVAALRSGDAAAARFRATARRASRVRALARPPRLR